MLSDRASSTRLLQPHSFKIAPAINTVQFWNTVPHAMWACQHHEYLRHHARPAIFVDLRVLHSPGCNSLGPRAACHDVSICLKAQDHDKA